MIIPTVAMASHALNGDLRAARRWAAEVRRNRPHASRAQFFEALPFQGRETRLR